MRQSLADEVAHKKQELLAQYWDSPTLFVAQCKVEYRGMGGTHGLKGLQLNQKVEVVEANVGPNKEYHLCRLRRADSSDEAADSIESIGWYPVKFLKEVEVKKGWFGWEKKN